MMNGTMGQMGQAFSMKMETTEMPSRKKAVPAKLRDPTDAERLAMADAVVERTKRPPPLKIAVKTQGNRSALGPPHTDSDGHWAMVLQAMGTSSTHFAEAMLTGLANISRPQGEAAPNQALMNALLAILHGAQPDNEVEAMLLVQMACAHELAMTTTRVTGQATSLEKIDVMGGLSIRFMRLFALQAETLAKLRRGGEQRVKVEHVHVHPGAQAIVGDVHRHEGGGVQEKIVDQPHAMPAARMPPA